MGVNQLFQGLCLIYVGGDTCAGCHAMLPSLQPVAEECNLRLVRVDVQSQPQIAEELGVRRVPSVLLADNGRVFASCAGYQPQEILQLWAQAKTQEYVKRGTI